MKLKVPNYIFIFGVILWATFQTRITQFSLDAISNEIQYLVHSAVSRLRQYLWYQHSISKDTEGPGHTPQVQFPAKAPMKETEDISSTRTLVTHVEDVNANLDPWLWPTTIPTNVAIWKVIWQMESLPPAILFPVRYHYHSVFISKLNINS